ncbi:hypothetical protein KKF61_09010 [Patescibacteria group bacterium]|nr:hypothetical protein [Patescibacteria group bacterium]
MSNDAMIPVPVVLGRVKLKECQKRTDLLALYSDYTGCMKCAARNSTMPTFSCGDPESRVAIIGLNPGAEEDREGVPFIGKAGRWFRNAFAKGASALSQPLLHPDNMFITNMARCQFIDEKNWNRLPYTAEYNNCIELLAKEIEIVNPDLLILFGKDTITRLASHLAFQKMANIQGEVFNVEIFHRPIQAIAMYHPSYLVRLEGSAGYDAAASRMWEAMRVVDRIIGG